MNLDRLRWGEWIAAIAALDLLLVTFRAWYKVGGGDGRVNAWDALEQGRYLLIATAVVGIFLWLIRAAEESDFPFGWVAAAVGFACTVYVAYRLASPPADTLDADIGLYLGLVSALGVTIGGLLSAREPAAYAPEARTASEVASDTYTGPSGAPSEPLGPLVADSGGTGTWSPAAPAATTGWSPASPAAPVPPATPAGAVGGDRGLRAGDSVVLTAGGARFPAGTVAEVVNVFAGGALVEVRAPDGMAERFEVPESAYEPAGAAPAGEGWSPAMPAPASEDWGFGESTAGAGALDGTATGTAAPGVSDEPKPAKTPWWKREIGGGKKNKDDDHTAAELGVAGAAGAGAAAIAAETNGAGDQKPGFFKRLFGGGGAKDEPETETLEAETTPATDVAGVGQAAESDTAIDEAPAAVSQPESDLAPGPDVASEPEAIAERNVAPEPEAVAEPDVAPEPEAVAEPDVAPEPEPAAPRADSESAVDAAGGAAAAGAGAAADPEPASEREPAASAPEPDASPREPEVIVTPEPPAAQEPEPVAEEAPAAPEPETETPAPEPAPAPPAPEPEPAPEPTASAPDTGLGAEAAGAGAAAAAAASAQPGEEAPAPKRKRSSGSRKVPKEALVATDDAQPKVGDEVQLKVSGGKYNAGTKGTVVDVFSAGVIVELSDDEGRTERLDLPFEAIGPADA